MLLLFLMKEYHIIFQNGRQKIKRKAAAIICGSGIWDTGNQFCPAVPFRWLNRFLRTKKAIAASRISATVCE